VIKEIIRHGDVVVVVVFVNCFSLFASAQNEREKEEIQ